MITFYIDDVNGDKLNLNDDELFFFEINSRNLFRLNSKTKELEHVKVPTYAKICINKLSENLEKGKELATFIENLKERNENKCLLILDIIAKHESGAPIGASYYFDRKLPLCVYESKDLFIIEGSVKFDEYE